MKKSKILVGLVLIATVIAGTNLISKNVQFDHVKSLLANANNKEEAIFENEALNEPEIVSYLEDETKGLKSDGHLPRETDGERAFTEAVDIFKEELEKYVDVRATNVIHRERISLPDFYATEGGLDWEDVTIRAYNDLGNRFRPREMGYIEELRRNDAGIDEFTSMIESHFAEDYETKYVHQGGRALDALQGFTSLASILASIGLSGVIAKFKAIVIAIKAAVSSLAIPFIGYAIFIALVVVALIALVALIISVWNFLKLKWIEVRAWFYKYFPKVAKQFDKFFGITTELASQSVTIAVEQVGNIEMSFQEVSTEDKVTFTTMVQSSMQNGDIFLMHHISKDSFMIALTTPVTYSFCVAFQTHALYSSYTYSSSTARDLIVYAGRGITNEFRITTAEPEIHISENSCAVSLYHYHHYRIAAPLTCGAGQGLQGYFYPAVPNAIRVTEEPLCWVHSFCGSIH